MPSTRIDPTFMDGSDFETIVGKIMTAIEPVLIADPPERIWMNVTEKVSSILREAWKSRDSRIDGAPRQPREYLRRRAVELFGGHCRRCRNYDSAHPCPTLDKKFPGCVLFEKEAPHGQ